MLPNDFPSWEAVFRRKGGSPQAALRRWCKTCGRFCAWLPVVIQRRPARSSSSAGLCALPPADIRADTVEQAYIDRAYTGEETANKVEAHSIQLEVVKHPGARRGFVLCYDAG